ncbi:MAG TPA: OB-fold domain-containing protein [Iamia sp.]|nr:OB-fold domain-containing protein [Iamia sp.]
MSATTTVPLVPDDAEVGAPVGLLAGTCAACGRTDVPRRDVCAACGGAVDPVTLATTAVLSGSTAVLHQPPGSAVEAPYALGVARFPEGLCVMGLLLAEVDSPPPLGTPVAVVAHQVDQTTTYAFRPL